MAVTWALTTSTRKIAKLKKRFRLLAGGMRASKTISVLMYLITRAQYDYRCSVDGKMGCQNKSHKTSWKMLPTLTSVVSETYPHLEKGAIRDFKAIMQAQGYWVDDRWNETKHIYTFETGSQIEFFSADDASKVRGPSRDRLFCNEVNNITSEAWEQLVFRTRDFIFADWNPVGDFFMYEEYGLIDEPPDGREPYSTDDRVDFLILTYRDNEALEAAIVEDIERKAKVNLQFNRVYAKGLRGNMEATIFKDWKIYEEIPHEARLIIRGLDYGYARDKAALCDIYYYNGGYIVDELVARIGMNNRHLSDVILNQDDPNTLTIADSAESKSIAEMQEFGVNIVGVEKKGHNNLTFTQWAIRNVQQQRMGVTKRSTNYIKSYRNFMWQTDKDGNVIPKYDHYMSDEMMSVVYGMTSIAGRQEEEEVEYTSGDFAASWV